MSAIEGQTIIIQTTPRTIALDMHGRSALVISSAIVWTDKGQPSLAVSVLIGAPGSPQIIRSFWEDEFHVPAQPIAPVASQAPATAPVASRPNVTITQAR